MHVRCAWLLAAWMCGAGAVAGESSLSGTVTGTDGAPAANTRVLMRSLYGGEPSDTRSAPDGTFRFSGLTPDTYLLTACQDREAAARVLINVGPSEWQRDPEAVAHLELSTPAGQPDDRWLVVVLLLGAVLFWSLHRVHPYVLRVPAICWMLWAPGLIWLAWRQPALLMLQPGDAFWVGVLQLFVAAAIERSVALLARSTSTARRLVRFQAGPLVLYLLPLFGWGVAFALVAMRSGMPERQQWVFAGMLTASIVWGVAWWGVHRVAQRLHAHPGLARPWSDPVWWSWIACAALGTSAYLHLYGGRTQEILAGRELAEGTPLIHLLMLLAMTCLILSMLTFLLDRWRVPLLTILVLLIAFATATNHGDYQFPAVQAHGSRPAPAQALRGRERIVVVAAAGGGVQAAAWTTRVLGGLAEDNPGFGATLAAISSVSGGSVGALYFLATYPPADGGRGWTDRQAFAAAASPTLDAVTWGLVGNDLLRIFWLPPEMDRGRVLDRLLGARSGFQDAPLSRWADEVGAGFPAVLLNATEVETGRPVVFSNTRMAGSGIVDFVGAYRRDPEIVTAVRVSATFPYVSPVARPAGLAADGRPLPHLADGGYYDNFGLYALMDWLRQALVESGTSEPLLVIRIEAFPLADAVTEPVGWPFQVSAPLATMMNVRNAAQRQRNEAEFALFREQIESQGREMRVVTFRYAPDCGCPEPPLSWDLSPVEAACVNSAWLLPEIRGAAAEVSDFLNPGRTR